MNKNEFYEALNRNREYALEHHGIKGQKWGLRRFQNPDGTLTEAGKEHYGRKIASEAWKQSVHEAHNKVYDPKSSKVIGATMLAVPGAFAGAVEGGLTSGNAAGVAIGGIGGAMLGGLLGVSIEALSKKLSDRSYKKSIERANRIVEKYGDEEYDGTKIKGLVKVYKDAMRQHGEAYYNINSDQAFQNHQRIHQQNVELFNQHVNLQNQQHMMGMM